MGSLLPARTQCPDLPGHVLQGGESLSGAREHETSLAAAEAGTCSVQIVLILFNLDGHGGDIVIEFTVSSDLPHEAPVFRIGHRALQDVEVASWSGE
jgi:hypothetical protein